MNFEDSFEYVFHDILKKIRPIPIYYGHTLVELYQDQDTGDYIQVENPYWKKSINIDYKIRRTLVSLKKEIQKNRSDYFPMLIFFISQFEEINDKLKFILNNEDTLNNLVHKKIISLTNFGKSYDELFQSENERNESELPEIPLSKKNITDEEIFRECQNVFPVMVNDLDDFILFLKHQSEVTSLEKNEPKKMIKSSSSSSSSSITIQEKREIKRIISKNNIEDAFDRLMEIFDGHAKENDLIQLLRRYNKNKKNLHGGLLSNDDLQMEENKIVEGVLEFIK
ncbi:MAG: hypothetical protein AB8H03_27185 [Saprospiraceae bacterium]